MSLKVILTLVMAFMIAFFSLFNTELISINLLGVRTVSLPSSFLVFFAFIAGAVYAAILSFQMQLDQALLIRKLRKKMQELNALIEDGETQPAVNNRKAAPVTTVISHEQAPAAATLTYPKALLPVVQNRTKEHAIDATNGEELDLDNLLYNEEDEAGVSARLKEIALRRIKNG
jgi:uncharacterized integral membrane protein